MTEPSTISIDDLINDAREPELPPEYTQTNNPTFWVVSFDCDAIADPVYRLTQTKAAAVQALRDRLTVEYGGNLQAATLTQMYAYLEATDPTAHIGITRVQLNNRLWI